MEPESQELVLSGTKLGELAYIPSIVYTPLISSPPYLSSPLFQCSTKKRVPLKKDSQMSIFKTQLC